MSVFSRRGLLHAAIGVVAVPLVSDAAIADRRPTVTPADPLSNNGKCARLKKMTGHDWRRS